MRNRFEFRKEDAEYLAKFIAELIRQGIDFKVDQQAGGFVVILTGGC